VRFFIVNIFLFEKKVATLLLYFSYCCYHNHWFYHNTRGWNNEGVGRKEHT